MRSLRTSLLLPLAFIATGHLWAANGEPVVSDSAVQAFLGSLNLTTGMTRAEVVERLGPPPYTYEKDRVTSYPVYEREGELLDKDPGVNSGAMQLMIQFSAGWRLERTTLIKKTYFFWGGSYSIDWLD